MKMFLRNRAKASVVFFSIQILMLIYLIFNFCFHDVPFSSVVLVFLYQLFIWFVSGFALLILFRISVKHWIEVLALSYAFGGVLSVVVYVLFMMLRMSFLLPYVSVIEACVALWIVIKNRSIIDGLEGTYFDCLLCLMAMSVFLFLSLGAVSFVNTFPNELTNGNGYYVDWPFWVGNNISFTKSFPADSFRQVGEPFKYHYLSSVLIAQVSLCTGVDVVPLSFYYSSVLSGVILVLTAYYFTTRLTRTSWGRLGAMTVLLFTNGAIVTFAWHILMCPFGFDYGYAYGMISLGLLAEMVNHQRYKEFFWVSCVMLAMTTGCKGPIALVVLAAYGVVAISDLFERRFLRGIICGVSWLISFVLAYITIISTPNNTDSEAGLKFVGGLGIDTIVSKSGLIGVIYNEVLSNYRITGEWLLIKLYSVWLYIYRSNKAVMTLLIIAIILGIRAINKNKFNKIRFCFVIASLIGILLSLYFVQIGGSQMYFVMAMFPTGALAGISIIEDLFAEENKGGVYYVKWLVLIVAVVNIAWSISLYYDSVMGQFRNGIARIRDKGEVADYNYFYADAVDYEAFDWIEENTDDNAIVAVDSHVDARGMDNSMIAGMFSQRYIWNEYKYVVDPQEAQRREQVVAGLLDNTETSVKELSAEGVDYILYQVADGKENYASECELLKKVYENAHYIVYEIE